MRRHHPVILACAALGLFGAAAALAGAHQTTLPAPPSAPSSATPTVTDAGPPCGDRDELMDRLYRIYAESPTGAGLVDSGSLVEIVATPGGRTWTLVLTRADGTSCVIAAGEYWVRRPSPDLNADS
ncbi:MAG: hypothetical protein KDE22_09005 [Rhodobacterales bacterium]|nr:hypothetical protein [Rhodobacterales bacterium]